MIPPSIVLIFYGLVTETSIKALFTASFLPGFMLATFFIVYIVTRTRLNPDQAPLPEPEPGEPEGAEKGLMFLAWLTRFAGWVAADDVRVTWVPGAWELPVVAQRLASGSGVDAVVALGAVIKGSTDHYTHVAGQCAAGLMRVQRA